MLQSSFKALKRRLGVIKTLSGFEKSETVYNELDEVQNVEHVLVLTTLAHHHLLDAPRPFRAVKVPPVHHWNCQRRRGCCVDSGNLLFPRGHKRSLFESDPITGGNEGFRSKQARHT